MTDCSADMLLAELTLDRALQQLNVMGCDPRRVGGSWSIRCPHPSHDDAAPSATISAGRDGTLLLHCFSRCDSDQPRWLATAFAAIRDATPKTTPTRRRNTRGTPSGHGTPTVHYTYSRDGEIIAQKIRYTIDGGGKTFGWRRPYGTGWATGLAHLTDLPIYNHDHINAHPGLPVFIVEGEKDADLLTDLGLLATCSPHGSNRIPDHPGALDILHGRRIIIIADHDQPGVKHAHQWATLLHPHATVTLKLPAPDHHGADLSDHLAAGHTLDQLRPWPAEHDPTTTHGTTTAWNPQPDPTTTLEDQLFAATPLLEHIREAARARLTSPWALLGAVLARTTAETHHAVVLPPIVGTPASTNLYIGLVGPSGVGKTASTHLVGELIHHQRLPRATVQGAGTGEGLINSLLTTTTDESGRKTRTVKDDPNLCILIDEIGYLDAQQHRQGSTIAAVLRSAWSGALLDTINADPDRIRRVPAHTYRLAVIAGIQPEAAHILLDDAATGTPQRWLWLPATDPHMPDTPPEWPGPITWTPPPLPKTQPDGRIHIQLPPQAITETQTIHRARLRGEQHDNLDGHLNLTRLKTAAALAILHGSYTVDTLMWDLAAHIITKSNDVRDECVNAVQKVRKKAAEARGIAAANQKMAERKTLHKSAENAAKTLWRTVDAHAEATAADSSHAPGAGCTRRCAAYALRGYKGRVTVEEAVQSAIENGWIRDHDGRWSPGDEVPA